MPVVSVGPYCDQEGCRWPADVPHSDSCRRHDLLFAAFGRSDWDRALGELVREGDGDL